MADEETNNESGESSKKKGGKLLPIIVGGLMLVEGVVVFGAVKMLGGGPSPADAAAVEGEEAAAAEAPVEIPLVQASFQNMQTGRVWEWKVEVYLRARQKNVEEINRIVERDAATIKEGIALIFRRAQDRHLREPGLETITRQVTTYLNEIFGTDPDGIPRIERVIIPECKGFPADG
ncbi:MAG: hypothetical protein D6692_03565 [Planctomycetota bacterium]|nr:MAG: hypothetical protein D6692_03565 [Planctomycetota bacterium]